MREETEIKAELLKLKSELKDNLFKAREERFKIKIEVLEWVLHKDRGIN